MEISSNGSGSGATSALFDAAVIANTRCSRGSGHNTP
jgi:hypothetical protein